MSGHYERERETRKSFVRGEKRKKYYCSVYLSPWLGIKGSLAAAPRREREEKEIINRKASVYWVCMHVFENTCVSVCVMCGVAGVVIRCLAKDIRKPTTYTERKFGGKREGERD